MTREWELDINSLDWWLDTGEISLEVLNEVPEDVKNLLQEDYGDNENEDWIEVDEYEEQGVEERGWIEVVEYKVVGNKELDKLNKKQLVSKALEVLDKLWCTSVLDFLIAKKYDKYSGDFSPFDNFEDLFNRIIPDMHIASIKELHYYKMDILAKELWWKTIEEEVADKIELWVLPRVQDLWDIVLYFKKENNPIFKKHPSFRDYISILDIVKISLREYNAVSLKVSLLIRYLRKVWRQDLLDFFLENYKSSIRTTNFGSDSYFDNMSQEEVRQQAIKALEKNRCENVFDLFINHKHHLGGRFLSFKALNDVYVKLVWLSNGLNFGKINVLAKELGFKSVEEELHDSIELDSEITLSDFVKIPVYTKLQNSYTSDVFEVNIEYVIKWFLGDKNRKIGAGELEMFCDRINRPDLLDKVIIKK